MSNGLNRFFSIGLTLLLLLSVIVVDVRAAAQSPKNLGNHLQLNVKSAILIEASTGQVLYEYNADEARPPASMSKMMTEYLVMEAIRAKRIKWEDIVTASKNASDAIGSGQLIAEGESLSVRDMVTAMAVYSANDASIALAEFLEVTEQRFAQQMNQAAKQLGMNQSTFINSTGLSRKDMGQNAPKDIPGETLMSARDVSTLARAIVTKHPELLEITKIPKKKLRSTDASEMINWNWMLEGNQSNESFKPFAYVGVDGLKTGYTQAAGNCFTGTAVRNGMRLISVVMGADSQENRFNETRKLLDYGFNQFEVKTLIGEQKTIKKMETIEVIDGVDRNQQIVTKNKLNAVIKKGTSLDQLKITVKPLDESKRTAPIKKDDVLATATYELNGQQFKVDMIAAEANEEASWIRLMFRAIGEFFANLF